MAQDITHLSSEATVRGFVEGFIAQAEDGSQHLDQDAFVTWLSEQFSYMEGTGAYETEVARDGIAVQVGSSLAGTVNLPAWQSHPAFPPTPNAGTAVTSRLVYLKDQLAREAFAQEAPYNDYHNGLYARAKALFSSLVAPSFPKGIKREPVSRVYVETFVTDRGEESRPSAASSLLDLDANDSASIVCSAPPSGRNISHRRLYRSATGSTQSAYRLQGEYPIATTVISDAKKDAELNEVCPSFGWLEPPATLSNLTALPNGILVGSAGRTLHACEPFHPYAWPAKYDKPLPHDIVGIVAAGQSAFVATKDRPFLITGADSSSLSEEVISSGVPCSSARSMVAVGASVFYASPYGLALYENGQVSIVSGAVIDRELWLTYNPESMLATEFDGNYLLFFTRADNSRAGLVFDYRSRSISMLEQGADALLTDKTGTYALVGTQILDLSPADGTPRTGHWNSKTYVLDAPQGFGWAQVDADYSAGVTVRLYADGVLHQTLAFTGKEARRVKAGKFKDWRIEIDSADRIHSVVLASTTSELKAV